MAKEIIEIIEIPEFILGIPLTKGRRAKKDKDGKITNKAWLNKPRVYKINGQDLWSGIDYNLRAKISKELKKYLYEQIRHIKPIDTYPIGIDMEFHLPINDKVQWKPDVDNICTWWRKCLHDALTGNLELIPYYINDKRHFLKDEVNYPAKILDDNVDFIREANTRFVPCEKIEDRKLIITINKL